MLSWRQTLAVLILAAAGASGASAATLSFDNPFEPARSYSENGMTITATETSASLVEVAEGFGGFGWSVPCCPSRDDQFQLQLFTGGLFNLDSIRVLHSDEGDPVVFEGFSGGASVASADVGNGFTGLFNFAGFSSLDLVRVTVTGWLTDPTFDDLSYSPSISVVPLPASGWLLVAAFGALALRRRRAR